MGRGWQSRLYHTPSDESNRSRDIFPLPFLREHEPMQHDVSRCVEQRIQSRLAVNKLVNRAVFSLNSMWFGGGKHVGTTTVSRIDGLPGESVMQ